MRRGEPARVAGPGRPRARCWPARRRWSGPDRQRHVRAVRMEAGTSCAGDRAVGKGQPDGRDAAGSEHKEFQAVTVQAAGRDDPVSLRHAVSADASDELGHVPLLEVAQHAGGLAPERVGRCRAVLVERDLDARGTGELGRAHGNRVGGYPGGVVVRGLLAGPASRRAENGTRARTVTACGRAVSWRASAVPGAGQQDRAAGHAAPAEITKNGRGPCRRGLSRRNGRSAVPWPGGRRPSRHRSGPDLPTARRPPGRSAGSTPTPSRVRVTAWAESSRSSSARARCAPVTVVSGRVVVQ